MPETTARIAAGVLAATFAWAGIAKLIAYQAWRVAVAGYRLPEPVERAARPLVPVVELGVAVVAIGGRTKLAAALTLALVGAFSLALVRGRAIHGDRLPCGCFGGRDESSAVAMMWRNGALGVLALGVISSPREPRLFAGFRPPDGVEVVALLLVVTGIVVAAWMAWQVMGSLRRRQAP
jgi:hypothetical protein